MADRLDIRRAAVLGAGVMGAGIAAHVANAGIPVLLLDVPPAALLPEEQAAGLTATDPRVRNRLAQLGLKRALEARPPAFFTPGAAALVTVGNLEDDLPRLASVDWVLEAVIEDAGIKRRLFQRLAPHLGPRAVLTSNTSGLSVAALAESLAPDLRRRFFVTHFFNPPRHLHLLELVAAPETDPALLAAFAAFAEDALGKGCVVARDTPNFIANRVGTFAFLQLLGVLARGEGGVAGVAGIDALTGELIGRPKSATFRTADLVGLDTLLHVARHLHAALERDPQREVFRVPEFVERMVQRGQLGAKTGFGFYARADAVRAREQATAGRAAGGATSASGPAAPDGREILMLDPATLGYVPTPAFDPGALAAAARIPDAGARVAALLAVDHPGSRLLWQHLSSTLAYAASVVPEISPDLVAVDRALRWGFGWALGPFELWDALGVRATAERLAAGGAAVPPLVEQLLRSGATSFHRHDGGRHLAFDPLAARHVAVPARRRVLALAERRAAGGVVEENAEASLIDLGEEVLGLEFHSRLNALGQGTGALLARACERLDSGAWRGLVIGSEAEAFSAGANLKLVLSLLEAGRLAEVSSLVEAFQQGNQRLARGPRPVVVAPRGLTLGGGCELLLHGAAACAAAEAWIGLVEVGAGLLPAAGGCKELLRRLDESLPAGLEVDLLPFVQRLFLLVGQAQVSTSAAEARAMGYLSPRDRIVMNADQQLLAARQLVLDLDRDGWRPPAERQDIRVLGEPGLAALNVGLWNLVEGRALSAHDRVVGGRLAHVLCGGAVSGGSRVSESWLLELEREAFLSLCGERATQQRMAHLLKTGKPLRN